MIVCSLVSEGQTKVPNSTQGKCSKCGKEVWLSPSTVELITAHSRSRIVCTSCFHPDSNEKNTLITTPTQLKELRDLGHGKWLKKKGF